VPAADRSPAASTPFTVLAAGADLLAHGHDPDAGLTGLLERARDQLGSGALSIFVQDPDGGGLQLVAAVGLDDTSLAALVAAVADMDHPIARAAEAGSASFDAAPVAGGGPALRSHIPLTVGRSGIEETLGVLAIAHQDPFDSGARDLATAVADLAAMALDRARLGSLAAERSAWFERLAHTDPLTGLANARTFGRVLELELARAGRQPSEVSVAIFDVDGFGAINSDLGREAGDDVLRAVAAVLAESVRLVDTVARYGGDEFVVVAPGSAGVTVAQRVLDGIARLDPIAGRSVSVSAGVARFPLDGATSAELLGAAEAALDRARTTERGTLAAAKAG